MQNEKFTFMNSYVEKSLAQKARVAAAQLGISRSEFVRRVVSDAIKQQEVQPQKGGAAKCT